MSDELYMRLDDAVKRVNLLCKWEFGKGYTFDEVLLRQELEQICQIPSPVEVVRCRDCAYSETTDNVRFCMCEDGLGRCVADNEFCSEGVKK